MLINPRTTASRRHPRSRSRGFTLIELLVVVTITVILASITVATINITIDGDKVRSAARQVQSYLEGARDRAIFAKAPRGVRFLLDPSNPRIATSLVYIAPTDPWTEGRVRLERADGDNDGNAAFGDSGDPLQGSTFASSDSSVTVLAEVRQDPNNQNESTGWVDLYARGVLRDGCRIQIPYGKGQWYTVDTRLLSSADPSDNNPPARLLLQQEYRDAATTPAGTVNAFTTTTNLKYKLELLPAPLPNQDPIPLPRGSAVHLDRSSSAPDTLLARGDRLPSSWKFSRTPANAWDPGFGYSDSCDIMFSPRGFVTGPEASSGLIHLYISDQNDALRDQIDWALDGTSPPSNTTWTAPEMLPGFTMSDPSPDGTPYQRGDKVIVSIFTRTGAVSTNPLFVNPATQEVGVGAQRFRYSELGEVAGR